VHFTIQTYIKNCEINKQSDEKVAKQLQSDVIAITNIDMDISSSKHCAVVLAKFYDTHPTDISQSENAKRWSTDKAAAENKNASIVSIARWENDKTEIQSESNNDAEAKVNIIKACKEAEALVEHDKAVAARWATDKTLAEKPDATKEQINKWENELSAEKWWLKNKQVCYIGSMLICR